MSAHSFHMIFSPQSCSLPLLDATLTEERRTLAEQLLDQIRSNVGRKTSSHTLIVGPRGSGKTHILSFIRKTLGTSANETPELLIMPLAEEEHGMTTHLDFLIAALRSYGKDIRALNPNFGTQSREIALRDAISAFDAALAGKTALILIENLSSILSAMGEGEQRRLRSFLQTHEQVSMLATSIELFSNSSRPDHPFYGFYSIQSLRPLNRKEARTYLAQLARSKGDKRLESEILGRNAKPRIDAIYDLTGGNHRLLAMLSTFLSVDDFAELVGPFVQMVDRELTPYYQQRLDHLTPQQKKILMAIADHHGRALSVKEIALYTFSTSQVVSRQLADLFQGAFVRRTMLGRESLYELNEPLLRLVLDIKEGQDRPLPLVVAFLCRWYDIQELRQFEELAPANVRAYYSTAIDHAVGRTESFVEKPAKDMSEPSFPISKVSRKDKERLSLRFSRAQDYVKQGLLDRALKAYDNIVLRYGISNGAEFQKGVAEALFNKGVALGRLNRSEEAIAAYDDVVNRFLTSNNPELQVKVAMALVNKGVALGQLNRSEEAIAVDDDVVNRFGTSNNPELQEKVARALVNKSYRLGQLNQSEEAIAVYDNVVNRFGTSNNHELQEQVAMALVNKGITLGQLNQSEEAIAVYDDVVNRFGTGNNPRLQEKVATALALKAQLELKANRFSESLALSEKALSFKASHPLAVRTRLRTLFRLGKVLEGLQFLRAILPGIKPRDPLRSNLVKLVLEEQPENQAAFRELLELYREDADSLSGGFMGWVQGLLPMSEANARTLGKSERTLADLFGSIPAFSLPLQFFAAIRKHAMGDRRALLDLPLEIRRLLPHGSNKETE